MSGTVNLRQARKLRERMKKRAQATENAARHGIPKEQRDGEAARLIKSRARLDAHRRED